MSEVVRPGDLFDVQCDHCKALHPLRLDHGHALACMDRLNNTDRPCPACGRKRQWVMRKVKEASDV